MSGGASGRDIFGKMRLGVCAALLATPVVAEPVPGGGPVETRAGVAEVFDDTEVQAQRLRLGETVLFEDGAARYVWLVEQLGDLLLVGVSNGGTGCPALFTWVHAVPGDVRVVEPYFGTCGDIVEVSHDAETVTVAMPAPELSDGWLGFVYDGRAISEVVLGQRPSPVPPGADAAEWAGMYPFEMLRGSDWRPVFEAVIGRAAYLDLTGVMGIATPFEMQGDWIIGRGCNKFDCETEAGAIALNLTDGRLGVVLRHAPGPDRFWGDLDAAARAGLQAALDGG